MTRHDIPDVTRQLLDAAIRLKVCDAADIMALAVAHIATPSKYTNFQEIHDEITGFAWANRHTEKGRAIHAELLGILEAPSSDDIDSIL